MVSSRKQLRIWYPGGANGYVRIHAREKLLFCWRPLGWLRMIIVFYKSNKTIPQFLPGLYHLLLNTVIPSVYADGLINKQDAMACQASPYAILDLLDILSAWSCILHQWRRRRVALRCPYQKIPFAPLPMAWFHGVQQIPTFQSLTTWSRFLLGYCP